MPWTFGTDVDRDAGDRGHPAILRLLLQGRDPRRRCSRATRDSTLAEAHWLGIPGSIVLLRLIYALGLAAALLTAIYMTRMMLYTFHGPNRTGEAERQHLREAPWVMTGPLVVLGVLSAVGGWLNLPAFLRSRTAAGARSLARSGGRRVVADSITQGERRRTCAHRTEYTLIGIAVGIALVGIWIAWRRLKPQALVPKPEAKPEAGLRARAREQVLRGRDVRPSRSSSRSSRRRATCSGAASTRASSTACW